MVAPISRTIGFMFTPGRDPATIAATMGYIATASDALLEARLRSVGEKLQRRIRRNASGRPGPNVRTGRYRNSIGLNVRRGPSGKVEVRVGTNHPAAARLEFGFTGVDSRGRAYNQPPYPHFGPAMDQTQPEVIRDLVRRRSRQELERLGLR